MSWSSVDVFPEAELKKTFAMHVVKALGKVISKKCGGCVLGLLSQLDHICLNFNVIEDMNVYWSDALASDEFDSVSFEYYTWAEVQNLLAGQPIMVYAFFNATGMWTEDIKGMVASFMFARGP